MGAKDPSWLHVIGEIAFSLLVVEILFILVVVLALAVVFAVAAIWIRTRLRPLLDMGSGRAIQAMRTATTSSDRVVRGIAEFYGRRQALETGIRVFLFGPSEAKRVPVVPLEAVNEGGAPNIGNPPLMGYGPGQLPAELQPRADIALGMSATADYPIGGQRGLLSPDERDERDGHERRNGHVNGHQPNPEQTTGHAR